MTKGNYSGAITISEGEGFSRTIDLSSGGNQLYSMRWTQASFEQALRASEQQVVQHYLNQGYRPSRQMRSRGGDTPPESFRFYKAMGEDGFGNPIIRTGNAKLVKHDAQYCYIYVDENKIINVEDINDLAEAFDIYYNTMITCFGSVAMDIDGYSKVFLLLTDLYYEEGVGGVLGYFWGVNEYPRDPINNPYSNEKEILFLTSVGYEEKDWFEVIKSTAAHEFQHMINFTNRAPRIGSSFDLYQYSSETFINEGLSMVAEDIAIAGFGKHNTLLDEERVIPYLLNPAANSLCTWENTVDDYNPAYMFMRYSVDRIGEDSIKRIIQSPRFGVDSLLDAADEASFLYLLRDWLAAVYLDSMGKSIAGLEYKTLDLSDSDINELATEDFTSHMDINLPDTSGKFLNYTPDSGATQITIKVSGDDRFKLRILMFPSEGSYENISRSGLRIMKMR